MDEFLAHPAVQAAVAPFLAALAVAAALRRTRLLGLAVAAAFAVAVGLTMGYSFEAFTAARKLELVGFATAILVVGLELGGVSRTASIRVFLSLAVAASAVWVLWRVLQQQEPFNAVIKALASGAFAAMLLESDLRLSGDRIRSATSALMLGLAVGAISILGASVVLGQLGIAVAAGAGAALLVLMRGAQRETGWTFILPAAIIAGLTGLVAVFTASLPWFCLLPLLAIPWATRLVPQDLDRLWRTAFLTSLAALVPVALAVVTAWFTVGSAT